MECGDQFARIVRTGGRTAAMRQQIRRQRYETALGQPLSGIAHEVRHAEDFVNDDHSRRRIGTFRIGYIGRNTIRPAHELDVFRVDVGGRSGGQERRHTRHRAKYESHRFSVQRSLSRYVPRNHH